MILTKIQIINMGKAVDSFNFNLYDEFIIKESPGGQPEIHQNDWPFYLALAKDQETWGLRAKE